MDNFSRKAIVSLLSSYTSQFATTAVNLATKLIIARLIVPDDLGLYSLALLVLLGCDMLVDLGIGQHLIREKHRPYGNVFLLRLSISIVLFVAIQFGAGLSRGWGAELPAVLRALAIVVVTKAAAGVPGMYLDRELIIHKSVVPQLARLFITAIVSIWLGVLKYGVWALVYGSIAGEVVYAAAMWKAAYGRIPMELTFSHTFKLVRDSRFLFLIAILGFVLQQGDVAVVGSVLNSRQVAYYGMAYFLVVTLSKVVESAIYRVIYPMFCEYRDDLSNFGRIYRQATLAITAIEAPMYFFLLFNAPILVKVVLGEKWMPAAILMQALSITGIINPFSTFGSEVLRARKKDRILTLSTVIGAITLMVSGYLLTRRYGTIGMVAANYLILGSIPTIIGVYKILKPDFIQLSRELAVVYVSSFAVMALAYIGLPFSALIQGVIAGLLIPCCWYMYYRVFGNGIGRKTVSALLSPRAGTSSEGAVGDVSG